MLIHFPSALFPMDLICSVIGSYTGHQSFVHAAFIALCGGVLFGFIAIVTGAFDLIGVAEEKPLALKKALVHGGVNATVVIAYSVLAFQAYMSFPDLVPDGPNLLFVKAGFVTLMVVGNYIGGSLILKHRVGLEHTEKIVK